MYVCLCHGVTDRAIRQAARDGVSSFEELQQRTGVSTCCGACREYAEDTWQEALSSDATARVTASAQLWHPAV
ncbi:(2Fe-2S)-binding protein [Amnimonas aquatica]|uniref:Bacterioferritin-associated ferredoxin n=1 Tax=Amnimonas aquatica TaxID=2094561 RepID=A0A2P6AUQ8_9GAMM|nr:(2Fe-2S)-binding protein [Amnimonas aquatica]PQA50866.1 (2Fe-2S)-binding protein [Amnimonas aquatica]